MRFNCDFFSRKKNFESVQLEETKLARVLNTFDLSMLGIGCTFGSGVYVLIGNVIANYTGPSIIFSFIIAGIATFLAGLAYAELGARVPRSGSAYVYIYVTIGEFVAFIIGWDLVLEYMIGAAGNANALSQYINSLCGNQIKNALKHAMPLNIHGLAPFPDFLALGVVFVAIVILIFGVKESALVNRFLVCLNTAILLFIIIAGATKANFSNWNIKKSEFSSNGSNYTCAENLHGCGSGGMLPFGFSGMIQGAAKCFYAYIGFDAIATTGEEVKNPLKALPLSILITLVICSIAYLSVSIVVTLMIPYYLIDSHAPFPSAFHYIGYDWAKYIISIGAIVSLSTCLYGMMYPMSRIVYSISDDGLLFNILSKVIPKFKTPAFAIILTGFLTAILASIFDLDQLVEMSAIGTLLAYSLVSACLIILRYRPSSLKSNKIPSEVQDLNVIRGIFEHDFPQTFYQALFSPISKEVNKTSSMIVNILTISSVLDLIFICLILTLEINLIKGFTITVLSVLTFILSVFLFIIWRQPQDTNIKTFKIPLVPFFPMLSIFINIYLMMSLTVYTWIRFVAWFAIGFAIYFTYSIRKSHENKSSKPELWFPCIEYGLGETKEEKKLRMKQVTVTNEVIY